ncbi:MAG: TIGR04282 family arsenosugar biosynthesis glycosyltransferase [Ferruginibacter sp.]|nr:TIGR04282 family arsenosugar biosynthesis glycosyltransferase [Ferruginibacter sp.]
MKTGLIIFIRNPVAGKVKTRIAKTMGDEKALLIYNQLLAHTRRVTLDLHCDKFLYYSDRADQNDIWENDRFHKKVQHPGDLGLRMSNAFNELFKEGYNKLLIIGSDCIELNELIINNAFETLNNCQVVIGPSSDGGYYLLGMTTYFPGLFLNKEWGMASVLKDTLQDLANLNISVEELVMLNDIDEEKDLPDSLLNLSLSKQKF